MAAERADPEEPGPGLRFKKKQLEGLLARPPAKARVIFLDEKGAICAKEYGGRSWREKRKRLELGQKINGMRNLFGGLDVIEGRARIESYERRRSGEFCDFLRKLKEQYFGYGLWLVMDNVPVHKSKLSLATLEELGIHQFWLPKASPELNPQELVWKLMQSRYINNRDFRDVDEIEEMVADFEYDFNQRRVSLNLSRYNGRHGS